MLLKKKGIMAGQTAAGVASSSSDLDGGMEGYPHSHSLDSNEGDRSRSGSDASGQVKRGGGLFGMISSVVGGGGRKDDMLKGEKYRGTPQISQLGESAALLERRTREVRKERTYARTQARRTLSRRSSIPAS